MENNKCKRLKGKLTVATVVEPIRRVAIAHARFSEDEAPGKHISTMAEVVHLRQSAAPRLSDSKARKMDGSWEAKTKPKSCLESRRFL